MSNVKIFIFSILIWINKIDHRIYFLGGKQHQNVIDMVKLRFIHQLHFHVLKQFIEGVTSLLGLDPLPPMSHFVIVLANPLPLGE